MFKYTILIFVFLFSVACQPIQGSIVRPSRLTLATSEEPSTLDPQRTSEQDAQGIFGFVCEPLVYLGIDLLDHPLLAESWQMAEDGLSLDMTLRQDVIFHDGTSMTADAVQFTFERLKQSTSINSPIYEDFQNVEITIQGEYSLQFHFDEPRQDFIETLRNPYAVIISPTAVKADEESFGRNPICTGPYKVKGWNASQYVLLERFEDYAWPRSYYENQGPARIDEIQINFVSEHDTRYLALLNKELDILSLSTSEEVAEINNSEDYNLYESWIGGISYLGFNYQRPPTSNSLVRQALSHAIDKETIIKTVLPRLADPAYAPLAPSILGFSTDLVEHEYKYEPELSRQLLAEAGYVDSDNDGVLEKDGVPFILDLLTTTSSTYEKIFTLLQSQLQDIGVGVTLRAVPANEISQITPTGEFDLLLYHYNWPYPSALSLFLSCERIGASNRVAYCNEDVDTLLKEIEQLPDTAPEKIELLRQVQVLILQDAPWQPLLVRKQVVAANERVQGIRIHPHGGLLLHDAFIK